MNPAVQSPNITGLPLGAPAACRKTKRKTLLAALQFPLSLFSSSYLLALDHCHLSPIPQLTQGPAQTGRGRGRRRASHFLPFHQIRRLSRALLLISVFNPSNGSFFAFLWRPTPHFQTQWTYLFVFSLLNPQIWCFRFLAFPIVPFVHCTAGT